MVPVPEAREDVFGAARHRLDLAVGDQLRQVAADGRAQRGAEDLHAADAPARQDRLDRPFDGLDLGQLGHGSRLSSAARRSRA